MDANDIYEAEESANQRAREQWKAAIGYAHATDDELAEAMKRHPHLRTTKHLGVILDDDEVRELSLLDMEAMTVGLVSPGTLRRVMNSPLPIKKQFIRAALEAMERNHFISFEPSTIGWVLIQLSVEEFTEYDVRDGIIAIGDQPKGNSFKVFLIRQDTTGRFYCDQDPTILPFGICQGCRYGMPTTQACPNASITPTALRHQPCVEKGPSREYFYNKNEEITNYHRVFRRSDIRAPQPDGSSKQLVLPDTTRQPMLEYLFKQGDTLQLSYNYSSGFKIHLDATVHGQERRPVLMSAETCFLTHRAQGDISGNYFMYLYQDFMEGTNFGYNETIDIVDRMRPVPRTNLHPYSQTQIDLMDGSRNNLIATAMEGQDNPDDSETEYWG